jgi:hypothetical protein
MDDESRPPLAAEGRPLASISDDALLRRLGEILVQSRRVEADLVAHIAEVDERRLYAREAFPSMFAYCTGALHLSEGETYLRIAVARASREHPVILAMLGDGRLHLSGIALLAPHLTVENRDTLLRRATHRPKRQIEELIAEIAPRRDVAAVMRRLPESRTAPAAVPPPRATPSGMGRTVTLVQRLESLHGAVVARKSAEGVGPVLSASDGSPIVEPSVVQPSVVQPSVVQPSVVQPSDVQPSDVQPAIVRPLSPGRYSVRFTASAGLREKLERLRALMRSRVPDGDLGAVIEAAVTEKLERLEARRFASVRNPRRHLSTSDASPSSRHVPSAVRRAVRERDGSRCRYVDRSGRRCEERDRLEYHHRHPFGFGGDHDPQNVLLNVSWPQRVSRPPRLRPESDGTIRPIREPGTRGLGRRFVRGADRRGQRRRERGQAAFVAPGTARFLNESPERRILDLRRET